MFLFSVRTVYSIDGGYVVFGLLPIQIKTLKEHLLGF